MHRIPVATLRGASPMRATPSTDRAAISTLKLTIDAIRPLPDGAALLAVTCGNVGLRAWLPPGGPKVEIGKTYIIEQAKGESPFFGEFTAIYPADEKTSSRAPNQPQRSKAMHQIVPAKTLIMTSREIAELVGKEHAHVMRDIRAMMNALEQNPELDSACKTTSYIGSNGQSYPQYELDKDTCLTLLLGYDAVARMKVVKRWQELEAQAASGAMALPDFTNPAIAARAWAEQFEQREKLAIENQHISEQLAVVQPKAEALERIANADGSMCIQSAAKHLQVKPKSLFKWLNEHQWIYRRAGGSGWLGYQARIQAGLLEHKVTTIERTDGSEKIIEQCRITPRGLTKLGQLLAKDA